MLRALAVDIDNESEIDAKCKMIDYYIEKHGDHETPRETKAIFRQF